ncbi:unnamed protein product [Peronospora belbahrii]|uniref:Jacalin-type lectin domain-containing protein n=1 Tax=Peronospora belbahrii TaxID=622444 RepID=A0AAU9KVT8_9STRA|nr:unnamed protein product [Peronospora belbahrii]
MTVVLILWRYLCPLLVVIPGVLSVPSAAALNENVAAPADPIPQTPAGKVGTDTELDFAVLSNDPTQQTPAGKVEADTKLDSSAASDEASVAPDDLTQQTLPSTATGIEKDSAAVTDDPTQQTLASKATGIEKDSAAVNYNPLFQKPASKITSRKKDSVASKESGGKKDSAKASDGPISETPASKIIVTKASDDSNSDTPASKVTVVKAPEPSTPSGKVAIYRGFDENPNMTVKDSIVQSEFYGGPHGKEFSDKNFVNSGQTIKSVSIYAGKRFDGITIEISEPKAITRTHGGTGGTRKELQLRHGEYINLMEIHWSKHEGRTRIFFVKLVTSAGNSLSGGSGDEVDALGAIWAYIPLVTPPPALPPAVTDKDSPGPGESDDLAGSLSEVKIKQNKRAVQLSDSFGGPHGTQFSDQLAITSGMTIASVTIRAGKRVDGLRVEVSGPKQMTFVYGGKNGKDNTITLESGEYITTMEVHWGKKNGHTRVFYICLSTSKGKKVAGGSQTSNKGSVIAPKGYQLAGFFGRYSDEIDLVGAVWSSIAVVDETSVVVTPDDNIVLSQLFGGPHGNAFSDIDKVKFQQTISSVTIRSQKRLDSITLRITKPKVVVLNHGGHGGKEQTLVLGPDEHITSVEAHWGKENKHTRVFYICLTTSAGKTLSGGTKTESTGVLKPPEGFVFGGFFGRAGDEVDQLGVIWTRKTAKDILVTDVPGLGIDTYGSTIRNWVGPTITQTSDNSCYRRTYDFDSKNICPLGYGKDGLDCIAQCPMSYPVECGLECIPQNDDCALAVLTKVMAVFDVALNLATGGVFGHIFSTYKKAKWAVLCISNLVNVIKSLLFYLRYRQTTAPEGGPEELLTAAYQANVVLLDLPIAVCVCMNIKVPKTAIFSNYVLMTVQGIVKQAITNGEKIIASGDNVMQLLSGNGMAKESSQMKVAELEDLVKQNSTCGWELKRLTDRVTRAVLKYRSTGDSTADVRTKVYRSSIVLNDIPIITNNCMTQLLIEKTETTAYQTRDLIRRTFGVIIDQLIDIGKTDNGSHVAEDEYMLEVANMGLTALSIIDPYGIAYMAAQFVQPICGPTAYLGEIDDGTVHDALGLTIVDEAFEGSYGSYTHAGDGVVRLIFESVDTKDVTVVVRSGGDEYAEVDVGAGDITSWEGTFPELEDKTMYLDRWRPSIVGIPLSTGGSLLLWIPRSSEGGHITLHVRIN